jgi:uncharacterized membrane protein (DUF485 family)
VDIRHQDGGGVRATRWREIAGTGEFRELEAMRRRLVLACLGPFVVAFGTFLVLCGYARPFMRRSVDGGLTVAYVWLLCLTVLAWILAWTYLRVSERRLEPLARQIREREQSRQQSNGGGSS